MAGVQAGVQLFPALSAPYTQAVDSERNKRPGSAFAEDLRRVGVALIIAGLVGAFMREHVASGAAIVAALLGALLCGLGYWIHHKEVQS